MQVNNKIIIAITAYRIPVMSSNGLRTSIAQYNRMKAKVLSNISYHKEILDNITKYLHNKEYNDLIVVVDWNEDILSPEIQFFYRKLSLKNVHTTVNNISHPLDLTHINRSKCIDSISITVNLIDFVKGSIMIKTNEIIYLDYY